jgi:hypothetical protein
MNPDLSTYKWPDMTHPAHSKAFSKLGINKILYMGPWFHIEPTLHAEFKNVKEFIYIDTQPRCENEKVPYDEKSYKTHFVHNLKQKCYYFGYELLDDYVLDDEYIYTLLKGDKQQNWESRVPHINPHVFLFKNKYTQQRLKYYISTNFLYNMTPELRNDICNADGLILSGYFPDKYLLNYFIKPKTIIGCTETYFPNEYEVNDTELVTTMIPSLFKDENTGKYKYSNGYFLLSIYSGHITKCKSVQELHEKSEYEYDLRIRRNENN